MIWLVLGMSVFCNRPLTEIVNLMDIVDSIGSPFTARSSVIQRLKTLGEIRSGNWHEQANHPYWHGLRLCGDDAATDNTAVGIPGNRTGGTEKVLRAGEALRVAVKTGAKLPARDESKMQKVPG